MKQLIRHAHRELIKHQIILQNLKDQQDYEDEPRLINTIEILKYTIRLLEKTSKNYHYANMERMGN